MKQIYVIRNIVNDKVYVGQATSAYDRFRRHRNNRISADKQSLEIIQAMKEIGVDNFYYEILEICEDSKADDREKYYIKQFDSFANGYNNTIGGLGVHYISEEDIEKCRDMLLSGMTLKQIEIETHITGQTLKKELSERIPNYKAIVNKNVKADRRRTSKAHVNQYDMDGNFIRSFSNIREALESLGKSPKAGSIANCCKHRPNYNTAYGYKWEYAEE